MRYDLTIIDELDNKISVDDFFDLVSKSPLESRRWQYDWAQENEYPPISDQYWLDRNGFSFTSIEFS